MDIIIASMVAWNIAVIAQADRYIAEFSLDAVLVSSLLIEDERVRQPVIEIRMIKYPHWQLAVEPVVVESETLYVRQYARQLKVDEINCKGVSLSAEV